MKSKYIEFLPENQEAAEEAEKIVQAAIKKGVWREKVNETVNETDVEVCAELARQWDEEDVTCPPHVREYDKQTN